MSGRVGSVGVALTIAVAVLLSGCGKGKAPVAGKVTVDNRTVRSGQVTFVGSDGTKHVTLIGFDGRYSIELPSGEYKVGVGPADSGGTKMKMMPGAKVEGPGGRPKGLGPMKDPTGQVKAESVDPKELQNPAVIPMRYRAPESSGLKVTVSGSNETFDLPLKSNG